jgi:plasmid replication initiation protein
MTKKGQKEVKNLATIYDLEPAKNNLVTKSNIINVASYKLNVKEQRIVLTLISMTKPQDKGFKFYRIPTKEMIKFLGIKEKNPLKELEKILSTLGQKQLKIRDKGGIKTIQWLASSDLPDSSTIEGYVELEISQKLRPYLLELRQAFLNYRLENILPLGSEYSIRIYELLKQKQKLGKAYYDYDHLRDIFALKPNQYKLYADFKRRILLTSQKELLEKTDICFTFKEIRAQQGKRGRPTLKGIEFYISSNGKTKKKELGQGTEAKEETAKKNDIPLINRVARDLGSKETAEEWIAKVEEKWGSEAEAYIVSQLDYVDEKEKGGQVRNKAGYIVRCLENNCDYFPEKKRAEKEKIEKAQLAIELSHKRQEFKDSYKQYCDDMLVEYEKTLDKSAMATLEKEAEQKTLERIISKTSTESIRRYAEKCQEPHVFKERYREVFQCNFMPTWKILVNERANISGYEEWAESEFAQKAKEYSPLTLEAALQ